VLVHCSSSSSGGLLAVLLPPEHTTLADLAVKFRPLPRQECLAQMPTPAHSLLLPVAACREAGKAHQGLCRGCTMASWMFQLSSIQCNADLDNIAFMGDCRLQALAKELGVVLPGEVGSQEGGREGGREEPGPHASAYTNSSRGLSSTGRQRQISRQLCSQ
jgi:hypothetical protein